MRLTLLPLFMCHPLAGEAACANGPRRYIFLVDKAGRLAGRASFQSQLESQAPLHLGMITATVAFGHYRLNLPRMDTTATY